MPPAPVPAPVWPGAAGRAGPGWRGARGSPRRLHPSNALGRRPGQPKQEVCNSLTPGRGYFPPGGPALAPLKSPGGVPGGAEDRAGAGVPRRAPPFGSQPPTSLPTQRRETPRFLSPFPIASPMPVVCRAVPATQAAGPRRAPSGGQGSGFACPDPRHPWGHPCRGPRGSVWSCPQLGG